MTRRATSFALAASLLIAGCTGEATEPRAEATRPPSSRPQANPCSGLNRLVATVKRGHVARLSPDISFIPRRPNYVGTQTSPVHSGPWDYLTRVPLLLYGPGHVAEGTYRREATMADVAPTLAHLIGFGAWPARAGRVLDEAVAPADEPPRLVVTIVWDGGGLNALGEHADSWPTLERLRARGAWFTNMSVGSSPSVTPPIHTTLGTGAFPEDHGIPGLRMRTEGTYIDPFINLDPSNVRLSTLADEFDKALENRPVTGMLGSSNWHLGMVGHGASFEGGDHDPVALVDKDGAVFTNPAIYEQPAIEDLTRLRTLLDDQDRTDGRIDERWNGRDVSDPLYRFSTPAAAHYYGHLLRGMIEAEGFGTDRVPDLLYVNIKTSDEAGHRWGMTSEEVGLALRAQDDELNHLISFLDRAVGRNRWVIALTADHGQTPFPQESGGWAIAGGEIMRDANARFDRNDNGEALVDEVVSAGAFVAPAELDANDVTLTDIARWMSGYSVGDNANGKVPNWYQGTADDPVFDALLVGKRVAATSCD
jgi:predicted AlkP superfamily pyrophosphatase or phosphodiesterase